MLNFTMFTLSSHRLVEKAIFSVRQKLQLLQNENFVQNLQ